MKLISKSVCPWKVPLPQLPEVSVQILLVELFQPVEFLERIENADELGVVLQILIVECVEPVLFAEVPENPIHKTIIDWKECRLMMATILACKGIEPYLLPRDSHISNIINQ